MSQIRQNLVTGEWVIIAPERAKRGGNLAQSVARPAIPEYDAGCPFCAGNESSTTEEKHAVMDRDGRWAVRSVVNKFSVLSPTGDTGLSAGLPSGPGHVHASVNGVGLHEVIVEHPAHHLTLALFPPGHLEKLLGAWVERFRAFSADPRIAHVIVFKNHGADAGASQQHPHSQIVGLPIVPGQVVERIERARRFYADHGQCLACSLLAEEQAQRCRIVGENEQYIAFIPYAALSPYHLWLFPKRHEACFGATTPQQLGPLAELLQAVLLEIYRLLDNPAYNLVVRSVGPREGDSPSFHWYVSIVPRVNKAAGFELGTGMYVNPSSPEVCAKALRGHASS